jgi:hypothetical protein
VLGAIGWIGRIFYVVLSGYVRDSIDGRFIKQPADGSVGRYRPASGWEEIKDVNRCAIRLLGQRLVKEREVRDRVVDFYRQKKRVSSRYY